MRIALIFLFTFSTIVCFAQNRLSASRQSSVLTYVYKISPEETWTLAKSKMKKAGEKFLHSAIDSFHTGAPLPFLEDGNYLLVHANKNRLDYELKTVGGLQYKLVNNDRDFVLFLHTIHGNIINDAKVYLDNRQVSFDKASGAFLKKGKEKKAWARIYHQNVLYVFPVNGAKSYYYKRSFWKKISTAFPLKYIVKPIDKLLNPYRYPHNEFTRVTKYEKKFRGFLVFNKPIYKPNDTVKLKAFITNRKGNPVNKELLLRISSRSLFVDSIINTVKPYRKGAYEYSFVLPDSVDLELDEDYTLTLEEKRSRKYDLGNYNGKLDKDEYAAKRKVLIRGEFRYEEYELGATKVFARSDKANHSRGEEVNIYLKSTDENGLAVMDGRVKVFIKTDEYSSKKFASSKLFLPDILWTYDLTLDPVGETKLAIPDSIFPNASFGYQVECVFLNANNEIKTKTLAQHFDHSSSRIRIEKQLDSIKIDFLRLGKPESAQALVMSINDRGDTISKLQMELPAIVRINPFAERYEVLAAGISEAFISKQNSSVSCVSLRTKDSVTITLDNPQKLPVWASIYANKKLVYRGMNDSLYYKARTTTAKNYFVSLQYLESGQIRKENYTIPYRDKLLKIETNQPQFVYPGQNATINIDVINSQGKTVPNVDVTAYAFTSKFEDAKMPEIPYLGKNYKNRKRGRNYRSVDFNKSTSIKLNWQRWSKEMGLDTIEYYKFLHPKQFYINSEPARDSITQIAPFIVSGGEIQPIHMLYVDEVPVFFSQSEQLQRYSFPVSPGKHSFKFRTLNKMVRLDSFMVIKGVKTFISINIDSLNSGVRVSKMEENLTKNEMRLWNKYMILVEYNFRENFTYIKQAGHVYFLKPKYYYGGSMLVGPLVNNYAQLEVKNGYNLAFEVEAGYQYSFKKELVKQKQIKADYSFSAHLWKGNDEYDFSDFVLTEKEVDAMWQDYLDHRSATEDLFTNSSYYSQGNGKLLIGVSNSEENKKQFIKNVLLFRKDDPDFLRVYKGTSYNLGYLKPGEYSLFFLLRGDDYFIMDSIQVKANGINYYETGIMRPIRKDSVSSRIWDIISTREKYGQNNSVDYDLIKESYNQTYLDSSVLTESINGTIRDNQGRPIPWATVRIKGTRIATTTDIAGHFRLMVPPNVSIEINSVGFMPKTIRVNDVASNDYVLVQDANELNEVVVTGLRQSRTGKSMALAFSPSFGVPGTSANIILRGTASVQNGLSPLYVVDGVPVEADEFQSLNPNDFGTIDVLKDAAATAIYGSRGAGGVILITTKKRMIQDAATLNNERQEPGNILRRNFKDAAYWQPKLRTNADGRASFQVTFPDDITNWRTFVIAVNGNKQTGISEGSIKSFKALSANLGLPQFIVEGDSVEVIGKALNYLSDSVAVKRSFYFNNQLIDQKSFGLRHSRIDTFGVVASTQDSLKLKYTIERDNGYFDGEERSIPVFKQGVMEATGFFAALNNDTTVDVQLKTTNPIKIYADASLVRVFERESEKIRNYEYQCNEQLASKLKAWLVQKTIDSLLKRPFKGNRNVRELISKLNQNKSDGGLWGWWKNTNPEPWISLHVVEALLKAQMSGFEVDINKSILISYLIYNLESNNGREKITSLNLLYLLGAKPDFKKYIDTLEKHSHQLSMYDKLKLAELRQKLGMQVSLDSLKKNQHQTMFGNIYWGEDAGHFFDNSIQNTLLVYRLFRAAGESKDDIQMIRNYFLEKRVNGSWRNTYESSLILETILPDILVNDSLPKPPTLKISGLDYTVNKFPFATELHETGRFTVSKQGTLPVYFTAYEEHWNSKPERVEKDFVVNSVLEKNGEELKQIKAGDPVVLKINVTVKKDAEYVMVEIPIPAGCSYKDKPQTRANNEVHREYFKNKVNLFCSSLKKGDYTFTVSLLPRYSGLFTLNPAKTELMYFPVFFGREALKKISIQ